MSTGQALVPMKGFAQLHHRINGSCTTCLYLQRRNFQGKMQLYCIALRPASIAKETEGMDQKQLSTCLNRSMTFALMTQNYRYSNSSTIPVRKETRSMPNSACLRISSPKVGFMRWKISSRVHQLIPSFSSSTSSSSSQLLPFNVDGYLASYEACLATRPLEQNISAQKAAITL